MTHHPRILLVFLCLVGLCISAPPASANQQSIPDAIEETGFVLLDGTTWNKMSPEAKYAFVWGMGHVAEIERELAQRRRDHSLSSPSNSWISRVLMSSLFRIRRAPSILASARLPSLSR